MSHSEQLARLVFERVMRERGFPVIPGLTHEEAFWKTLEEAMEAFKREQPATEASEGTSR